MSSCLLLKFDASRHARVVLLVLTANQVLPLALMLPVKLACQGTKTILLSCAIDLVHFGPDLYIQGG